MQLFSNQGYCQPDLGCDKNPYMSTIQRQVYHCLLFKLTYVMFGCILQPGDIYPYICLNFAGKKAFLTLLSVEFFGKIKKLPQTNINSTTWPQIQPLLRPSHGLGIACRTLPCKIEIKSKVQLSYLFWNFSNIFSGLDFIKL